MKNLLLPMLAIILVYGLALPMGVASGATMTVVSDDLGDTIITGVYNKAGGVNSFVDLSGSPLPALRAWEPKPYPTLYTPEPAEVTSSVWDLGVTGAWFQINSTADWIWETHLAEGPASYDLSDPLYDADAARYGRVVLFELTFNVPGNPTSATLRIAADNGYEAWVNTGTRYRSPTAVGGLGWENSNLHQASLTTSGWQAYGTFAIAGSELVNGSNTLYVLAGNEYYWSDDGDSPIPPTQGTTQYNPGAAIFQLDVEYDEFVADPGIQVVKEGDVTIAYEGSVINYTYTVTNTGNVPLSSVALSDDLVVPADISGPTGDDGSDGILGTTEVWTYTGSYTVPESTTGPVANIATAEGYYETTKVDDTDEWSVAILHPEIEVVKSADTHFAAPGETVYYSYVVNNIGDCVLYDVVLDDDVVGLIALTGLTDEDADTYDDDLAIGASATAGPVAYVIPGDAPESLTNIATASGLDELDGEVTDDDQWTVVTMASRSMGYWKNHLDDWCSFQPTPELLSWFPGRDAEEDGMNPLEMLRAQLIAAELNVACFNDLFVYSRYDDCDIFACIDDAAAFLLAFPPESWPTGKKDQRDFRKEYLDELSLKDCLEDFNTMGDEFWE